MSWLNRFPEYADLPEGQQWSLLQAAKKQLRKQPHQRLTLAVQLILTVFLGVAVTQIPRLLSEPSLPVDVLFWTLGLLGSVFLGDYLYDRKLRLMIREDLAKGSHSVHEKLQGGGK
ncbi:MAG: hypothetical protein V2J20_10995 [Wenzhouxiangella sp.]|jgi:hypothetical protein|nr:hypothetical protein [Wenzhouxiangella sp.]